MISEAWRYKDIICHAIGEAERIKGSPARIPEIFCVYDRSFRDNKASQPSKIDLWSVMSFMQNLYREDLFFADAGFEFYSLTAHGEGFETFSQRFTRLFPRYLLDHDMNIIAGPKISTVNLA